jgi:hypothetical protein
MTPKTMVERRNRLCYLALYYAIQGNEKRSERMRRMVRRIDGPEAVAHDPMPGAPVPA